MLIRQHCNMCKGFSLASLIIIAATTLIAMAPASLGGTPQMRAVDYHDGERFPHLERDASKPDLLDENLQ